jgi:hypothetical protein
MAGAVSSKVSLLDCAKRQGVIGLGSIEPTSKVTTSRAAKAKGASGCGSGESTSRLLTSSASAKGQRVGNGGNSQCFSVVEPSANVLYRVATQPPISAAMFLADALGGGQG